MGVNLKIYGVADARTLAQIERCIAAEDGARGVLCADNHLGYSMPIGGAVAYREHISPSGVGYDIGCGNKAVRTNLFANDVPDIGRLMDEIYDRISFGMGRKNNEPVDHPVLDQIREAPFAPQRQLYDLAAKQLGTVGAGNHYVDIFADDDGWMWIGVHFGSRGFGHKTASGFLALAEGKRFDAHASEGEMDSPPILFPIAGDLGQSYIQAMTLAGAYAHAGRDVVVQKVLGILGAETTFEVHNHHNYAWLEQHDGDVWWVIRKGCTPAFPGQQGFVGATMGEDSVILEGTEAARDALFSTVHGAGRAMSRTRAAGKSKSRTVWECNDRECSYRAPRDRCLPGGAPIPCPEHGADIRKMSKRRVREQTAKGEVDWPAALADLAAKGIELRGGAADEAPRAYKRLDAVLEAQGDTIRVLHRLHPLGVAMAGADVHDPFKD